MELLWRENIINYMGNTSTSKDVCSISAAFANHVVQKVSHVPQLLDGLLVQWTHGPMDSGMCLRHLEKMRLSFHCGNKHVRNCKPYITIYNIYQCKHNLQVKTMQVDLRNYHSRIFSRYSSATSIIRSLHAQATRDRQLRQTTAWHDGNLPCEATWQNNAAISMGLFFDPRNLVE